MISTAAGSSPWLTTVRDRCGSSRANVPAGASISRPSTTRLGEPSSTRNTSSWSRSVSSCSGIRSPGGISTRFTPNESTPSERRTSSQLPLRSRSSRRRMVTPSRSMGASLAKQQALDHVGVLGAAEEEALCGVAAVELQVVELVAGLDALGGDGQAERVAEIDHGVDDRDVLARVRDAAHEGAVDLHAVDRE